MASNLIMKYAQDSSIPSEKRDAMLDKLESGEVSEAQLERVIRSGYAKRGVLTGAAGVGVGRKEKILTPEQEIFQKGTESFPVIGPLIKAGGEFIEEQAPQVGEALEEEVKLGLSPGPFARAKRIVERVGESGAEVARGLGQAVTGLGETAVDFIPGGDVPSPEQAQEGLRGLSRAVQGAFGVAGAPLAGAPAVEKIASVPFEAAQLGLDAAVEGLGIDPNSQQGRDITGALMNSIGLVMAGRGVRGRGARPTVKGALETAREIPGAIKDIPRVAGEAAKLTKEKVSVKTPEQRRAFHEQELAETTGKIIRGKGDPAQIKKAQRALGEVNVENVKTARELEGAFSSKLDVIRNKVDSALEAIPGKHLLSDIAKEITVGKRKVKTNFVDKALNQLKEVYEKTADFRKLLETEEVIQRAKSEGLTPKEINDVARQYGTEFKRKAFSAKGDPLTSVNAKAFENVRKGVKETARDFMPDDLTRTLDGKMSDMLATQKLITDVANKVDALKFKVNQRGIGEKVGGTLATAVDAITGGALKGFVGKLIPRNVGLKTMNFLDLQKQLPELLKKFKDLETKLDKAKSPTEAAKLLKDTLGPKALKAARPLKVDDSKKK